MSRRPIALSPDLLRLQNEGYDLEVRGGYLLVRDVPFVAEDRIVKRGILISKLELSNDRTNRPQDHVAYWTGEHPCHSDGRRITAIHNPSGPQDLGNSIRADFTFSAKAAYRDYHHKMTTYIGRITGEATKINSEATAQTFPVITAGDDEDSVFKYIDTATSRAGIGAVNEKLVGQKVGILGLGGTGSYILDLVAKSHVTAIHIFDGDIFSQHNAFRAPGAASPEQIATRPQKVTHFAAIYEIMRHGITVHDTYVDEANIDALDNLDFVFICLDRGVEKQKIVQRLTANGIPFIDVGMGVELIDGQLTGIIRVTTSTPDTRDLAAPHVSYADDYSGENQYASNIQIAELNALNAALAVLRWKKLYGLYHDTRKQYYQGFSIASGEIVSEHLE